MIIVPAPTINGKREYMAYWWWCPGCDRAHIFDDRWQFNGDLDKPTFTPSYLSKYRHPKGYSNDNPAPVGYDGEYVDDICHSYVTDGQVKYLDDSYHKLAGKTVPLPDVPDWLEH